MGEFAAATRMHICAERWWGGGGGMERTWPPQSHFMRGMVLENGQPPRICGRKTTLKRRE